MSKITVNSNGEFINGNIGNDNFSIPYSKEDFDALNDIATLSERVSTMNDFKELVESAKKIVEKDRETIVESACPYLYIDKKTDKYFLKYNGVVSKVAMPQVFADRILLSMDKGLDYMPVIKMWTRFLRNPKVLQGNQDFVKRFSKYLDIKVVNNDLVEKLIFEKGYSRERAQQAATFTSIQITKEGMMLGYKVSKELLEKWILDEEGNPKKVLRFPKKVTGIDENSGLLTMEEPKEIASEERVFEPAVQGKRGDAFMCRAIGATEGPLGHIIKVGCVMALSSWDQINTNDNQSCVEGLHVGGLDYIRGYQDSDTQTHNVVIDPMDIGAIPDDNTGAMRVLRYFVLDVFNGINNSIYHSSSYAAFTDSEFAKFVEETLKAEKEYQAEVAKEGKEESDNLNSLLS